MNILVVGNLYPPIVFGGYESLCAQTVEGLRERGHRVRILTTAFRKEDCPPDPDVRRELELTTDFPRPGEVVSSVDFAPASLHRVSVGNKEIVLRHIREERPDVIFAWCHNRLGLGAFFAAEEEGVPACYTINDVHPQQFKPTSPSGPKGVVKAAAEQWMWPMATFRRLRRFPIMIISEFLKRTLLEGGTPIEHAEVIYQAVHLEDLPFKPSDRLDGEPLRVCYVGQVEIKKGVHTLVQAVGEAGADAPIELEIVGTGVPDYEEGLRTQIAELGIGDRVTFAGFVPHPEICTVFERNHVLVFPSECKEGFGLSHVEAMAAGCAVVSTTEGGSAELIRDGVNALAYPTADAKALAERLRRIEADDDLRLQLIRRARRWVEERHAFPGYIDRVEGFLARTVAGEETDASAPVEKSAAGRVPQTADR